MITRRKALIGSVAASLTPTLTPATGFAQAILGDDGLYHQPWFIDSLLELADDLQAAAAASKRFAVIWELRGCPYCRETHLVNFAKPDLVEYVSTRFDVLQLNLVGAREVTDFDGEKLSEKRLAEKYGIRFTPTVQFFPDSIEGLALRKPREREIVRAQGYLEPQQFWNMFRFVAERAYERGTLRDFLKANS